MSALKLPDPIELCRSSTDAECTKRGMPRKKTHEVTTLDPFVISIAKSHAINVIVDFGSGLGYLTHELAKEFNVIAIESESSRSDAAQSRSSKLETRQKTKSSFSIIHVSEYLTTLNATDVLKNAIANLDLQEGDEPRVLLTGLHACGDLSATTMIELFHSQLSMKALVCVGCCYHLMDTTKFPQSLVLKQLEISLVKDELKLSCHTFSNFDTARVAGLWRSQSIRAFVQTKGRFVLDAKDSLLESLEKVEKSLNLKPSLKTEAEVDHIYRYVALLSTIRALVSPVIEAAVLIDRYCLLEEMKGVTGVDLVPVFNPRLSPRNHALVAYQI
jgi:hypothetical protein